MLDEVHGPCRRVTKRLMIIRELYVESTVKEGTMFPATAGRKIPVLTTVYGVSKGREGEDTRPVLR